MSIQTVVERARCEPPWEPPDAPLPGALVCAVRAPVSWHKQDIERAFGIKVPDEMVTLWDLCAGMLLYEDSEYGQSGLEVFAPVDAVKVNRKYRDDDERAFAGDLVFGRFLGDLELAIFRTDQTATDCGTIVIAAEIDRRPKWYTAARSLEEFLVRFMDAKGEKYWVVRSATRDRA